MNVFSLVKAKLSYLKQNICFLLPKYFIAKRKVCLHINNELQGLAQDIQTVEFVRNWVHCNSIHLIDDEHDQYAFFVPEVIKRLLEAFEGRGKKPHLSCGPRSYAMKELLDVLGVKSRIIDVFNFGDGWVNSHTLIDVYIDDEKKWVLQDPDFNVCYTDIESGKRISALCALKTHRANIGYTSDIYEPSMLLNLNNTIKSLFDKVVLHRHSYTGGHSVAYVADTQACKHILVEWKGLKMSFMDYLQRRDYTPKFEFIEG